VSRHAARTALLAAVLAAACAVQRGGPPTVAVPPRALPAFVDDLGAESLRQAVLRTMPAYARAGDAGAEAAARTLVRIVETTPDPSTRRAAIARAFRVVRVRDPLLLTAYYEPELAGRLTPDARFAHPLYARPPDLVDLEPGALDASCSGCRRSSGRLDAGRLVPYFSRGEIEAGALAGRGLEIAWVEDPFALFVLHVQGSGRLRLPDGRTFAVRYAGSNGRPYTSLGRTMIARGLLPEGQASLWDIRRVLGALPAPEQRALLATNARYTFFRLLDDPGDPVGSLGVPLTAGRSVATDPRLVPPGALAYLATPSAHRFVVSQDTGGAVAGAHADLFLGSGADAEARAGRTREEGTLYLLLPRRAAR
jgi:membrane-bound lytic murein transglycosylase A